MAEKEELTRLLYVRSSISRAGKEPKPRGSSHRRFRLEREGEGGGEKEGGRRGEGERGRQRGEEKEKRWGEGEERREECRKGGREGVKT